MKKETISYESIMVTTEQHVTRITLNRPEVLNSINQRMQDELQDAFDQFATDDTQYLGVIAGAGDRAFSAGTDLKYVAQHGRDIYPRSGYAGLIERFELDKPLIAAVDGIAAGGGFEIALACDIIIATRRSLFGLPEPKVGAVALGGGLHRLARQIGLKQAMGLIMTGDLVDAAEGYRLGFITVLVDPEKLEETVNAWCGRILRCAPLATRASKQTVMRGLNETSLEAAIREQKSYPAFKKWSSSEDLQEGVQAFASKRVPQWRGR
jgi:crotonobetainyl-CoA hydratase